MLSITVNNRKTKYKFSNGLLKEKYKAAAEAIDLLDDRIKHLNEQFAKQDKSAKDYNIGMEAFNETILSTVTALKEQEDVDNIIIETDLETKEQRIINVHN